MRCSAGAQGGTRVTWMWDVDAKSPVTVPLVLVLRVFWKSYAAKALAACEALVPQA